MKIYSKDIYDGKNSSFIKEYLTKKYKNVNRVVVLAILLANNYDVMSRVRDEGRLSYKINTVEQVRVSQSERGEVITFEREIYIILQHQRC